MTKFPKPATFHTKKEPPEIEVYLFYTTYSDGFLRNKLSFSTKYYKSLRLFVVQGVDAVTAVNVSDFTGNA